MRWVSFIRQFLILFYCLGNNIAILNVIPVSIDITLQEQASVVMTEIILRELNNSDISWMALVGSKVEVAAGDRLLRVDTSLDRFYLVLEGKFELIAPQPDGSKRIITTYTSGDIIGFFFLLNACLPAVVQAFEQSLVLAINCQLLIEKIQQNAGFGARFYRSIAMLLSHKQSQITSRLRELIVSEPHLGMAQAILPLFSHLHDSDICWMTTTGEVKQLEGDTIYLREGQSLETLDIVLEGCLLLFIQEGKSNALAAAFGVLYSNQLRNVAQAFAGDILGVTAFLDRTPNHYLVKTTQETRLLSIPITNLRLKFQADVGFAARFYQALASLTAERLAKAMLRLAGGASIYEPGCSLCDNSEYEGELDIQALQQLSVARAKFNWMLQQLGVKDRT